MTEITCKCGAVYKEKETKLPVRDKDESKCGLCGAVLRSWNGGVMYTHTLISEPPT